MLFNSFFSCYNVYDRGIVISMLNKKGQALVEFVIILPIFLFMLFSVIDFGKILYIKNNLESKMADFITAYEKESDLEKLNDKLQFSKEKIISNLYKEGDYIYFTLEKDVEIITPGLNLILGNPYKAKTSRVIYHE